MSRARRPRRRARLASLIVGAAIAIAGEAAHAQSTDSIAPPPSGPRFVGGQVVRPAPDHDLPVAGVWAILHRVAADRAGPLDSMRTGADGRYHFRYRPFGSADAIYFVSSSYGGIAYFTPPLRGDSVVGDPAVITVFDTTTRDIPLDVRGRHVVVSGSSVEGARSMLEVFELSNDTSIAVVSGPREHVTWTTVLPQGARDFRVGQGDVPAEAVTFADGRVLVYAPFPPGVKQISFSYTVPANDFPLSIPATWPTSVFEVLLEDPQGRVSGAGLRAMPPVEIEGRRLRRWLGQDVPANAVVLIELPRSFAPERIGFIIAVVLALVAMMLAALGIARSRRRRAAIAAPVRAVPVAPAPEDDVTRLAREIAVLDEARERGDAPDDYDARRASLKAELTAALAARETRD